jgi:glycosyltransferase involved in cell wall biosynthesis
MDATIVIATKDRKEDLKKAIASAVAQQGANIEVLVVDDGSSDGTSQMVRAEFPQVALVPHPESAGYIVRRNEGAKAARAPVIVSIDDDAEFSTPSVVGEILPLFGNDSVGVVAIPYRDVNRSETVLQKASDVDGVHWTASFVGTAHALRRDVFLRLGGFRSHLVHQGEEKDYSIRMLDAGFGVCLGHSSPILHYESPRRDWSRMDYYGRRNDVLFAWQNVPWPYFLPQLAGTIVKGLWGGVKIGRVGAMLRGVRDGLQECLWREHERKPVSRATYREFRRRLHPEAGGASVAPGAAPAETP